MKFNLKRSIEELRQISFMLPVFEAIANSLEAKATNIVVRLFPTPTLDLNLPYKQIEKIEIEDNGEGFTSENIESFSTVKSDFKLELGCKGIGRLTWLRVFHDVSVQSTIKAERKRVYITFKPDFDAVAGVQKEDFDATENKTVVTLGNPRNDYREPIKVGKNKTEKSHCSFHGIQEVKDLILSHFFIKLSLLKKKGTPFNIDIEIVGKKSSEAGSITSADISDLKEESFSIAINDSSKDFVLYYTFLKNDRNLCVVCLCANNRAVKTVNSLKFSIPNKESAFLLLTSPYLDENVNDARNEFAIKEKQRDFVAPISLEDIERSLQEKVSKILRETFPENMSDNQDAIEKLIDEHPHLSTYIRKQNPLLSLENILKAAKEAYDKEKNSARDRLKKLLKNKNIDVKELEKAMNNVSDISARELAQYIFYRQEIIEVIKTCYDVKEKNEKILQDIFMPKCKNISNENYLETTNIWLLDDKFMSFAYAASDTALTTVKNIMFKEKISDKIDRLRRPDIFMYYAKPEQETNNEAVIVEIKAIGAGKDEKDKSITELGNNSRAIRDHFPNLGTIWSYIVTEIDEYFGRTLESNHFTRLFSDEANKAFYSYNERLNVHTYAISIEALAKDAGLRNKVFLDIIKGRNKQ